MKTPTIKWPPLLGLLSFLPAAAGTTLALLIYFLVYRSISLAVLGLGGAVVFTTLDQAIACFLFMDRSIAANGKEAVAEIRSPSLMAVLIMVLAFSTLLWSGIPILAQLGLFAVLGLSFSFIFIHGFFPLVFPARRSSPHVKTMLQRLVNRCGAAGKTGAILALAWGLVMFCLALPLFDPPVHSAVFGRMFLMVGMGIALQLLFMFLDPILTAMALTPVVFTFAGTLGLLRLSGRALDTAGIMLATIFLVAGVEYALLYIRAYQRYQDEIHPSLDLIRMAIFLSGVAFLVVFGLLLPAEDPLLQSIGINGLLGMGHCLAGIFLLLPPMVKYHFRCRKNSDHKSAPPAVLARNRYRFMETYPRLFARFKLLTDPMFTELQNLLGSEGDVRIIIDIGSGYGVPGSWCLANFPNARVYGIEPDGERVRVAARAMADRGIIITGRAPEVPSPPEPADFALMLDMVHYLNDGDLALVLQRLHDRLKQSGRLFMRAAIPPKKTRSILWWLEHIRLHLFRIPAYYREPSELKGMLEQAGFRIDTAEMSGNNQELFWFVGQAVSQNQGAQGHAEE